MALPESMPIGDLQQSEKDTEKHATDYQASRGGHYPPETKPVPGKPKEQTGH